MVEFVKTYRSDGRPMYIAIDEPKWFRYEARLNPTPKPPDLATPIGRLNAKIATMDLPGYLRQASRKKKEVQE